MQGGVCPGTGKRAARLILRLDRPPGRGFLRAPFPQFRD